MKVTGILSISNGSGLEYPFPPVIANLVSLCDNVLVGVDPKFPLDRDTVELMAMPTVEIVDAPWDRVRTEDGAEIALQMDSLVAQAADSGSDWVVVMQADELLHDSDFSMLREFMRRALGGAVNGFSLERLYFWKDLETVREDWNATLTRIFRPRTYSFLAEGTDKAGMYSGQVVAGEEVALPYKIYHYSRVDQDPSLISHRVRNLDTFFHEEEALLPVNDLPVYDFITREHDNYGKAGTPSPVDGKLVYFSGTHPRGIREWYGI